MVLVGSCDDAGGSEEAGKEDTGGSGESGSSDEVSTDDAGGSSEEVSPAAGAQEVRRMPHNNMSTTIAFL